MSPEKDVPKGDPGKLQQTIAAITINFAAFTYGTMVGWPSPMTPQLQSNNPPVGTTPMSDEAASWLGGALCAGALLGIPMFGVVAEKFGRKTAGCLLAMPYGVCWLTMIFAQEQSYLFVARFFAGVGGSGSTLLVPLYVSEIASVKYRGMLGSLFVLFINLGVLATYTLGIVLSFRTFAICATMLPTMYLIGFIFMPETPTYLVRYDRISEAVRSLMWLRGGHKPTVEEELAYLRANVKKNRALPQKIGILDLFMDRTCRRGVIISFGLLSGQQLCGIFAMISYTASIFKEAGTSMSPDLAAIVVGVIQVIGSYFSTLLMERAGRRLLILVSCAGMCVCHLALGSFSYLQSHQYEVKAISWIPVVALSAYVIVYCLGMGPAPYVVASEVFSSEAAGLANTMNMFVLWGVAFVVLKFFGPIAALLGIHGCFFLFAGFCASTFAFTMFLVPETKGRTIESILVELSGNARHRSKPVPEGDALAVITNSSAPLHV